MSIFLEPHLRKNYSGGNVPIEPAEAALIYLSYIGSQVFLRELAVKFGRSKSGVRKAIFLVTDIIVKYGVKKYIRWPQQPDTSEVVELFREKSRLPGIIGAIDGCHLRVEPPSKDQLSFLNRKLFHSIVLLGVVLPNRLFSYVSVGMPGSSHDAKCLKWSSLWRKVHQRKKDYFPTADFHIIGDSAFPCLDWLIPVLKPTLADTDQKKRFNKRMSAGRVIVENCFGDLLNRFRRLRFIKTNEVKYATAIAMSACVIHNMCLINGDTTLLPTGGSNLTQTRMHESAVVSVPSDAGTRKRNMLIARC